MTRRSTFIGVFAAMLSAFCLVIVSVQTAAQAAEPTAAQRLARDKLGRRGMIDGVKWGIALELKPEMTGLEALEMIRKKAAAKPHELNLVIHGPSIEALAKGWMTDSPFDRSDGAGYRDVSVVTALSLVLPNRAGPVVLPDGTIVVGDSNWLSQLAGREPVAPGDPPSAADGVRERLVRKGVVDGLDWSVDLNVKKKPLKDVLQMLAEAAARKPHEVKILIDHGNLVERSDRPVTILAEDVSLITALELTLCNSNDGFMIRPGGTVLVSSGQKLARMAERAERFEIQVDPISMIKETGSNRVTFDPRTRIPIPPGKVGRTTHGYSRMRGNLSNDFINEFYRDSPKVAKAALAKKGWRFGDVRYAGSRTNEYGGIELELSLRCQRSRRVGLEYGLVTEEMVGAAIDAIRLELEKGHQEGMKWLANRKDELEKSIKQAEADLVLVQESMQKPRLVLDSWLGDWKRWPDEWDRLVATAPRLKDQIEELRFDLHGKQARIKVITAKIKELGKAAQADAGSDAIVQELQKVVAMWEKQLAAVRVLYESGRSSEAEVMKAEIELAQARLRLAERKEALRVAAGGRIVDRLNDELVTATIDAAETEARLKEADRQLAEVKHRRTAINQYTTQTDHARALKKEIDNKNKELQWLRESLPEIKPPKVTRLGPSN